MLALPKEISEKIHSLDNVSVEEQNSIVQCLCLLPLSDWSSENTESVSLEKLDSFFRILLRDKHTIHSEITARLYTLLIEQCEKSQYQTCVLYSALYFFQQYADIIETAPNLKEDIQKLFINQHFKRDTDETIYEVIAYIVSLLNNHAIPEEMRAQLFASTFKKILVELNPYDEHNSSKCLRYLLTHWNQLQKIIQPKQHAMLPYWISLQRMMLEDFCDINMEDFFRTKTLEESKSFLLSNCLTNIMSTLIESFKGNEGFFGDQAIQYYAHFLPFFYEEFSDQMPELYFSQPVKKEKNKVLQDEVKHTTYHNNYPYLNEQPNSFPVWLNPYAPIGYNIQLPDGEIKSVFIEFYGGHPQGSSDKNAYTPNRLSTLHQYLLKHNTAVITLNLPDLLKLDVHQGEMPESLHQEIHACIHYFCQGLKFQAGNLHPDLSKIDFQNIPFYLYGASFGGGQAIIHAQKFPHTFNGYISHNGYLSTEMGAETSSRFYQPWLDPARKEVLINIKQPILLMQSMDDNNVHPKILFDFVEKLKQVGKGHLARICVTQIGNPIPSLDDKTNKGHYLPTYPEEFNRYANTIHRFITHGPSALPAMTLWQSHQKDILANKFYSKGTLTQRFVGEIFERVRNNEKEKESITALGVNDLQDLQWNNHYKPIFYAMYHVDHFVLNDTALEAELKRLQSLLTDEMIKNALALQSHTFSQFLSEAYQIEVPPENELFIQKELVDIFKRKIHSLLEIKNSLYIKNFLFPLYQANPSLIEPLISTFDSDPKVQTAANDAKQKLLHSLKRERRLIKNVWQQTAHRILEIQKENTSQKEEQKEKPKLQ